MPTKNGTHSFSNTISDSTYRKMKEGNSARRKKRKVGKKIKASAANAHAQEIQVEFGRACKAGKLLRLAFSKIIKGNSDPRMISRLNGAFSRVIKTDPVNASGLRIVSRGNLMLLEGFDFNKGISPITALCTTITGAIDRASGRCTVSISSFNPGSDLDVPRGTTHIRIVTAAGGLNFNEEISVSDFQASANMPIANVDLPALSLTSILPAQLTDPIFLLMGVQFMQVVNDMEYPIKNGAFNALTILKVDVA